MMAIWSKVLGIGGGVAIALSIWDGNMVGLFGVGLIAVIVALVLWGIDRGREKRSN